MSPPVPLFSAVIQRDHVQDVQVLALVFVDALHLHVEHRIRVDRSIGVLRASRAANSSLLARLIARQRSRNAGSSDERLDRSQLVEIA